MSCHMRLLSETKVNGVWRVFRTCGNNDLDFNIFSFWPFFFCRSTLWKTFRLPSPSMLMNIYLQVCKTSSMYIAIGILVLFSLCFLWQNDCFWFKKKMIIRYLYAILEICLLFSYDYYSGYVFFLRCWTFD